MDAPHILKSDNGREFANQLVEEITKFWPECKMVHGKPRHSQSQESVERNNLDVENLLVCYMQQNNTTNWAKGLNKIQFQKMQDINLD